MDLCNFVIDPEIKTADIAFEAAHADLANEEKEAVKGAQAALATTMLTPRIRFGINKARASPSPPRPNV